MTEKEINLETNKNMSAPSSEASTPQEPKRVKTQSVVGDQTKLIIENKEFEIIPYRVNKRTSWYIPELGLVVERHLNHENREIWSGASGSVGNDFKQNPYRNLIWLAEEEVENIQKKFNSLEKIKEEEWKNYRNRRDEETLSAQKNYLQNSLAQAQAGLQELKILSVQKAKPKLTTLTGITTSQIWTREKLSDTPAYCFLKIDQQKQDIPVVFRIKEKQCKIEPCLGCGYHPQQKFFQITDQQLSCQTKQLKHRVIEVWHKPKIKKDSYLQVEGNFTDSDRERKSFTAYSYQLLNQELNQQIETNNF